MSSFRPQISIVMTMLIVTATAVPAQTTLKIDGSTGAMPLVAALAKVYEAQTAGLKIEIGNGLDTKARIETLNAGSIDRAVDSHGLKIDQLVNAGEIVDEIARTPVVLGVNASVPESPLRH